MQFFKNNDQAIKKNFSIIILILNCSQVITKR